MRGVFAFLFVVLPFLGACKGEARYPTPYQAFTTEEGAVPGGYIDRPLGPGEYVVTFRGDQYTLSEDVMSYAHRRARELCPGGYDTLAQGDVSKEVYGGGSGIGVNVGYAVVVNHRRGWVVRFPRYELQIRCKS